MTPLAITGLGIACAVATGGAEAFLQAMKAPRRASELAPASPQTFDGAKYPGAPIVEVPGFDPTKYLGDKGLRTLDRLTKLLVVAARLCLNDAGLKKDGRWAALGAERVGLCCSNAYGSLEAISELDRVAKLEDARYINPAKFPNTVANSAAGYVSIWEDLRALNVSVSNGNSGGLDAFVCTEMCLATGRAEAILTGGGEAMSEALLLAFQKLEALGDVRLGEGAALLATETLAHATGRGARVLGQVTGFGTAFCAPNDDATLLFASREAAARAIRAALGDAGLCAVDVDLVVSGASGLRGFDDVELAAIEDVLPGKPIAAPKLSLGETLGGGGTMSMAAALACFAGASAGPMIRGAQPSKIANVVVTSLGYYGNASAVVMRAPSAVP